MTIPAPDDRFATTPLGEVRDGQILVGDRVFLLAAPIAMYGLLLWELAPAHTARLPWPSALPANLTDSEGSDFSTDPYAREAGYESLISGLAALGLAPLPSDRNVWCIEKLHVGNYSTHFSGPLVEEQHHRPTPWTDYPIIQRLAAELTFGASNDSQRNGSSA